MCGIALVFPQGVDLFTDPTNNIPIRRLVFVGINRLNSLKHPRALQSLTSIRDNFSYFWLLIHAPVVWLSIQLTRRTRIKL